MNSIFYELLGLAVSSLRGMRKLRAILSIGSLLAIIALLVVYVSAPYWYLGDGVEMAVREFFPPILFLCIFVLFITLISYTKIDISGNGFEIELNKLREERDVIRQRMSESRSIEEKKEENIFDTIQLSLNQITEYYTINKSQARRSFAFSIFAIVAGLATLIGGIWLFYLGDKQDTNLAMITGISSVLIEFIGGAYFYLYNKSAKQLNFFYEKLVRMQDTMLAIQLAESLEGEKEIEIKEKIIMELINRGSEGIPKNNG